MRKMELPLWLVESLAKRQHVELELPNFYGANFRQALRADAPHLNLGQQSDFYFDIGVQLSNMLEEEADLSSQLLAGFASRFHELLGASLNATDKAAPRCPNLRHLPSRPSPRPRARPPGGLDNSQGEAHSAREVPLRRRPRRVARLREVAQRHGEDRALDARLTTTAEEAAAARDVRGVGGGGGAPTPHTPHPAPSADRRNRSTATGQHV